MKHTIKYEFHSANGTLKAWWGWRCEYCGAAAFNYDFKIEAEEQAAQHILAAQKKEEGDHENL